MPRPLMMLTRLLAGGLVLLVAWVAPVVAQAPAPVTTQALASLWPGPADATDYFPSLAIMPSGQASMVWLRTEPDQPSPLVYVANVPDGEAFAIGQLPPETPLDQTHLVLDRYPNSGLAWSVPLTDMVSVETAPLAGEGQRQTYRAPLAHLTALALDNQQSPFYAWAEPDQIRVLDLAQGITETIRLSPGLQPRQLSLQLDERRVAHLVWVSDDAGIHYANTISGTMPITVTAAGSAPQMALDTAGHAHLLWHQSDQLLYANDQNWASPEVVAEGDLVEASAIAVSPQGYAEAVWSTPNAIWHAHSLDWSLTRRHLVQAEAVRSLVLAVDGAGGVHLAWTQPATESGAALHYVGEQQRVLQVQLSYPLAGMHLTPGESLQALTNPPSQGWSQLSFYLAPADAQAAASDAWQWIATDRDGSDGWRVPLPDEIVPGDYRAIVLAITQQGVSYLAEGPSFVLEPEVGGQLVVSPMLAQPLRGKTALKILWLPEPGSLPGQRIALDLYLEPEQCKSLTHACQDSDRQPQLARHYLGRHEFAPGQQPASFSLSLDTRQFPDGHYRVLPRDVARGTWWPVASGIIEIDNAMPPSLSVVTPEEDGLVRETLQATAFAHDPNGIIARVDFYLERAFALFELRHQVVSAPDRLWVGSDTSAQDGWNLDVAVNPAWQEVDWRLLAIARDRDGLSQVAYSPKPLRIVGTNTPWLRILRPNGDLPLHDQERIVLNSGAVTGDITAIQAYLELQDGSLHALGEMQAQWSSWVLDWDTTRVADGTYRLQFVAWRDEQMPALRQESVWFQVSNQAVRYTFAEPGPGQTLQGAQLIRLRETGALAQLVTARFFWRDWDGALHPIGQDTVPENDWGILWQTASVLDGPCQIVAWLQDEQGRQSTLERDVVLRNHTPTVSLQNDTYTIWSGQEEIAWQASSPLGRPLTVSVAYSPDDGLHWLLLADHLAAEQSLIWNTPSVLDTDRARLRLVVSDGEHWAQEISRAFIVDNHNDAPQVSLLSPSANSSYSIGEMVVAWQASDPDGHLSNAPLDVGLDYRVQGSGWRQIRYDLDASGAFLWDDTWLVPDTSYDLRITARDALGAASSQIVRGIRLIENHPPSIRLLWPTAPVDLGTEAIILWQAQDEDNDPLTVDLYYSDNGGQAWLPLAEKLDNTGYFGWQLSFLPPSSQYRLRAIVSDGKSVGVSESQSTFVVGQQQRQIVSLLAPAAGQRLAGLELVRWSTLDRRGQSQVEIGVRPVQGQSWQTLAVLPNQGFYLWDTRALPDGAFDLRVTVSDTVSFASATIAEPLQIDNGANHAPQVKLLEPQGHARWLGLHAIRWEAYDPDGDTITATLAVSLDQGSQWQPLATLDGHAQSYLWDTSTISTTQDVLLAVTVSDGQVATRAVTQRAIVLRNRPLRPPHITLISPSTEGQLLRGDTVAWQAYDADGDPLRIAIWSSQTAGRTWTPLAPHLANTGQYVLEEPLPSGQDTLFKVVASDGMWASQVLSAATRPQPPESMRAEIHLTAPAEGARLTGDQEVAWRVYAPASTAWQVSVDISRDGGLSWVALGQALDLQGTLTWDTTKVPNGTYQLRVVASNERVRQSLVTAPMIVEHQGWLPETLSLLSPAGAESWSGLQELQWRARDAQGQPLPVDLDYSADRGATWSTIARGLRGTEHYTWDTTRAPNCEEVWLRISVEREGFRRQSLSHTSVAIRNLIGPTVRLEIPEDSTSWRGVQAIAWQAAGEPGYPPRIVLEASLDGGQSWQELARNLPMQGRYLWDTSDLPAQSLALVRLRATDRGLTARDTLWQPIVVNDRRPDRLLPFLFP